MTNFYDEPWDEPYLTPSIAVTLLTKTPYHAMLSCPFYGKTERRASAAMDEGAIVDGLVLGAGPDVTVIYADSFRKKAVKGFRDNAVKAGRIPKLAADWDRCKDAAKAVRDQIGGLGEDIQTAMDSGAIKRRLFWSEYPSHVQCSTEPDIHYDAVVLDLKRTRVAPTAHNWARHAAAMNYHVQAAACLEATNAERFGWIAVEADPPHCAVVHWASDALLKIGRRDWKYARAIWENCVKSDYFPAYESGVIDPMPWQLDDDDITFTEEAA